jgi:trans-aconitate methyltransferase
VDIAPRMLEVSRRLNPDCEHVQGDMRTVRLGRVFDAVFVHDAVDYMTTEQDLRAAIETAFVHCAPGGIALFVPDHVRETYEPYTDHGGNDGDGRGMRYLEWSYDPDPADTTVISEFVFLLHDGGAESVVAHERHVCGLFGRDEWLTWLTEAGFEAEWQTDPEDRCIFIARRPRSKQ